MKRRRAQVTLVILGILIGALTNVATGELPNMLPPEWRGYLWLAWMPLGIIILLVIILEWRVSRDEPPAPGGVTIRPSTALAQNQVTNSSGASAGVDVPRVQSNVAVADNKGTVIGTNIGTQIINQAQDATVLHQLRAPVGDFVGREREIDQLVQALGKAASGGAAATISGVRGLGGIGKTELAYAAAQRLIPQFPDAQLLIELRGAGSNPLTPAQALQAVIRAFEREARLPNEIDQLQALYHDKLTGKRVLILADDARGAAQVRPLLPPPGCALLVTSRHRFGLPGMAAFDLGILPPEEAKQLLLAICPRIGGHAPKLATLCGYLPLALRVSAGVLEANDIRAVPDYLGQLEAERLKHLSDPDDPQASMEASLRLSYDALELAGQQALGQISVFPASFDLAAVKAVVVVEGDVGEVLELLRRRSLLEWDAQSQRFSPHDLVRAFAAARMEDGEAVWLRYAGFYARLARSLAKLYRRGGKSAVAALTAFDAERAHFDTGWKWLNTQSPSRECDALLRDYGYLAADIGSLRYHPQRERIPLLETALAAARRLEDRGAETAWLGNLGNAHADLGDARKAIEFYEQPLVIAREIGDRRGEAIASWNLGLALERHGDLARAVELMQIRVDFEREIGHPDVEKHAARLDQLRQRMAREEGGAEVG